MIPSGRPGVRLRELQAAGWESRRRSSQESDVCAFLPCCFIRLIPLKMKGSPRGLPFLAESKPSVTGRLAYGVLAPSLLAGPLFLPEEVYLSP
jgi:hypothetical protein